MNVENNLAPKVSWLQDTFGITALVGYDHLVKGYDHDLPRNDSFRYFSVHNVLT